MHRLRLKTLLASCVLVLTGACASLDRAGSKQAEVLPVENVTHSAAVTDPNYLMGRSFQSRRQYEAAIGAYRKSLEANPRNAEAHNAIGNCHVRLKQLTLAEQAFKTAIELTPSVYPALNLSDVYINQGRLEEADTVLTRALHRNPTEGDAYYGLALLRVEQHRLEDAEQLAHQAHDHLHHIEDVHLLLAQIHQYQGRLDRIPEDLQLYVTEAKPSPTREHIKNVLADAYEKRERKSNVSR